MLTLSYINTALSQSAFRIYKCYIIKLYINTEKMFYIFFYNIAMSKARRIRKISVFTSGGKFPVLTLSYINTALGQSAFRIYKCYIIMPYNKLFINLACSVFTEKYRTSVFLYKPRPTGSTAMTKSRSFATNNWVYQSSVTK